MRAVRFLDQLLAAAASLTAAAVVGLVTIEVVARYVFGSSLGFATELAQLMFVWSIFLGLPLALVRGRHVGITLADSVLPPGAARALRRLAMLCGIALLLVVTWKAWEIMLFNWDQRLNTIALSAGLYYLPVIVGALASAMALGAGLVAGDYRFIEMADDI